MHFEQDCIPVGCGPSAADGKNSPIGREIVSSDTLKFHI